MTDSTTTPSAPAAAPASVRFTEEMKGHIAFGTADHREGQRLGEERGNALMFRLTITIDDVERFAADPEHQGSATGYVECEDLGGRLPVRTGWFNLFVDSEDRSRSYMHYRLWFADGVGTERTLVGYKEVHDDPGFDTWEDTTTLYVTVVSGHVPPGGEDGEPAAAGVLRIHPVDFAQQLTTFRAEGPSLAARVGALTTFNKLFLGELWDTYARLVPRPEDDGPGDDAPPGSAP